MRVGMCLWEGCSPRQLTALPIPCNSQGCSLGLQGKRPCSPRATSWMYFEDMHLIKYTLSVLSLIQSGHLLKHNIRWGLHSCLPHFPRSLLPGLPTLHPPQSYSHLLLWLSDQLLVPSVPLQGEKGVTQVPTPHTHFWAHM